jgi:hypothetical protein
MDTLPELFHPRVIAYFWPFGREEPHGHPPFYAAIGLIGDILVPGWPLLPRARLGSIVLFAITAGAIWLYTANLYGLLPALGATASWVLCPNLFGHGHYTGYDAVLVCLWVLSILAFAQAAEPKSGRLGPNWPWVITFGILVGCAANTKLTGWFLPLPFLAWSILLRNRRGLETLLIGGLIAVAVLYATNPPWWFDPVGGVDRFLRSNLNRAQTIPIKIAFLGQVYSTPDGSLPWYNTLVWTVFVTPVGFLLLALAGFARSVRFGTRTERFGLLVALHWSFLIALRALPHTPGHDGVRLFLPAFGCLALLVAPGVAWVASRGRALAVAAVTVAVLEGAASLVVMMPVPLSYFSPLVGGLPGAARLGMEPTYYWDALDSQTLAWLDEHTQENEKVGFASNPSSWLYLRRQGAMRFPFLVHEPGRYVWYVLQNRPGSFSDLDRHLIESVKPAHMVEKLGVPLLWVFPYDAVESWHRSQGGPGMTR